MRDRLAVLSVSAGARTTDTNSNRRTKLAIAICAMLTANTPLALLTATTTVGLLAPQSVQAQDATTGEIFGQVVDSNGAPVTDVTVDLTDASRGLRVTSTTGENGVFRFGRLSVGDYVAAVTTSSGERVERSLRVTAGTVQSLTFTVGGNADNAKTLEQVTVTGIAATSTAKDYYSQESGINIDIDQLLSRVPIARDPVSAALLAPGTSAGDTAFGNLPSFSGSTVSENIYYVNGYNATDPRRFLGLMNDIPFEFFQQVDIKTGGFQAEYGRNTGGVINLVTRRGSNEFEAGTAVYYTPEDLRAHQPDTTDIFRSDDTEEQVETNVWASGALIEDRLFFYGLVNFRKDDISDFSNDLLDKSRDSDPFWGFNIDGVLLNSEQWGTHSFTYTHIDDSHQLITDRSNFDRDTRTIGSARGVITQNLGGNTDIIKYNGAIRDWLTVSGLYGSSKARVDISSDKDNNPVIIDFRSGVTQNLGDWANFTINPANNDKRELYRFDADVFVDNFFGDHKFRLGFEHERLDSTELSKNSGGVYYAYFVGIPRRFDPTGEFADADVVRVRNRVTGGSFKTTHDALYLEDRWSITDRLTFNLGVRTEDSSNHAIDGTPFVKLNNQLDFRNGFTFDTFGDGTSRIFGFYGRTHLGVANNTNVRLAGSEIFTHEWFLLNGVNADDTPIIGDFFGRDQVSPDGIQDPRTLVSGNLKGQSQDEYILGFEKTFDVWTFGVKGVYRKLRKGIEDGAIDRGMINFAIDNGLDVAAMEDAFGGFSQFILFNPGSDVTFFTAADGLPADALAFLGGDPDGDGFVEVNLSGTQLGLPKVRRRYTAFELTAERAFADGWSLQGSYVWSRLRGTYEGGVKSDIGQTDTGLTQDFDTRGLAEGIQGRLPNDHTHTFKLFGSYQVSEQFTVGANVTVQSPRHFGCIGVHPTDEIAQQFGAGSFYCDLNQDGTAELTPRGSVLKSEWSKRVDLTLAFDPQLALPADMKLTLRADIFNLFNSDDVIDRNEAGTFDNGQTRPTFGDPTAFVAPRSVRLSARLTF